MRPNRRWTRLALCAFVILAVGCTAYAVNQWDREYGPPQARERQETLAEINYQDHIRPIVEQRCVVCHGCFDAPCQLNLQSFDGLLRGAHKDKVYDGTRLSGATLTRMFEDAQSTAEWRDKGFYPVLNERDNNAEANQRASVLARLLVLKQDNPLPTDVAELEGFDFETNRSQECPKLEEMDRYERRYAQWGMPYGLPSLNRREHNKIMDWLARGAPEGKPVRLNPAIDETLTEWEAFFNGGSKAERLTARYLYEHLYLANLHFDKLPDTYFKLVRSKTPPGEPIERISTRRPFDDPGVERVYYRLWHDHSAVVAKLHLPYKLDEARKTNWRQWFLSDATQVDALPDYDSKSSANPFITFADLPVEGRYRFLLDEAQFTIMNFIKGPVCRGQVALNVIQDHFWVYFTDPDLVTHKDAEFLANNADALHLPAEVGDTWRPISHWRRYSRQQEAFLTAKAEHLQTRIDEESNGEIGLDWIWDGDGNNDNAALTIFRHSDSATVSKGLIGQQPKTAWVIDYPLLERIHYLLVAGFDVYGNVSHQLLSRLYMDFLRIEGEMNFIALLPEQAQDNEVAYWYRDAEDEIENYLSIYIKSLEADLAVDYQSGNPKAELFERLRDRLDPVLSRQHEWPEGLSEGTRDTLSQLHNQRGSAISYLPQTTLIEVPEVGVFTVLRNNAYSNLSSLFWENQRRRPEADSTTLAFGIIGAYPNAFMRVEEDELADFTRRIGTLASETDYRALRDRYGIRRNDPEFWATSDRIHAWYLGYQRREAGLLDYNRLENR
ncbi:fatty acid cis/trans isomerase [Marinimicrobium alkaliphilum]|uniref:fatty acid cis/trans isomerase n=1 Tax=Marinimicrobium alkaliphilum TaxID=2202654 RepID=UPI000DB90E70|nr:fatty acid cis/trans isomerase [Marinimicrobium alkaliphilum]